MKSFQAKMFKKKKNHHQQLITYNEFDDDEFTI